MALAVHSGDGQRFSSRQNHLTLSIAALAFETARFGHNKQEEGTSYNFSSLSSFLATRPTEVEHGLSRTVARLTTDRVFKSLMIPVYADGTPVVAPYV